MKLLITLLILMIHNFAYAAAPTEVATEIGNLLTALEKSNCQFNRNGDWHTSAEAKAHLQQKFEYLDGKNLIKTTEDFIALGATKSSMSGKPYLVKCENTQESTSANWLNSQLQLLRTTH